ncbi:hypothetical protein MJI20_31840, partial [Salmonella enterica subsp. enterica serovar Anatum]|nr:hypothetical protein [Salmonella enterica subsp. enterica serovar Anatum]
LSSMLLLTVVSFKQRALWGWLGLIFVVVLAMSGWLKWQVEAVAKIIDDAVARIREQVGDDKVILGLSGGVDSSVTAMLLHRAIG